MGHRGFPSCSVGAVWRRAREVLRQEGPRSLWFKVLGEICYRRLLLLERVFDRSQQEASASGHLSMLTTSDLGRYGSFQPHADLAEIRARLEQGEICFAMNHESEIIHACWIRRGRAYSEYLDCEIEIPSDTVYAYEAFTHPKFRGRGVAGARARLMEAPLLENGYRAVLSMIGPENYASLRFNQQAGHRIVGRIGYYGLGPWRRYFCKIHSATFPTLSVKRRKL